MGDDRQLTLALDRARLPDRRQDCLPHMGSLQIFAGRGEPDEVDYWLVQWGNWSC